jgi:dephospho-CoA kinase
MIIGITGGIGSGKSVITDELIRRGYTVLDADIISREAVRAGSPALEKLVAEFGSDIIGSDGALDRKLISEIIFASSEKMTEFNQIMKTAVGKLVDEKIAECETAQKPIFLSAALLYEADWDKKCDAVWLVTADDELRTRRATERDGVTHEKIRERMAFQMPESEKRKRADVIIENNGTRKELMGKLVALLA